MVTPFLYADQCMHVVHVCHFNEVQPSHTRLSPQCDARFQPHHRKCSFMHMYVCVHEGYS